MSHSRQCCAAALLVAVSLTTLAGCGAEGDGLTKHPVRGTVLVNGSPEPLVVVSFLHTDANLPGRNARHPVGVTDENGEFQLSTNGAQDGAVEGEYLVTFEWLSANDASAYDRLGGAYSNSASSPFRVRIKPGENELEPFELTVDESRVRKPPRTDPAI